MNQKSKIGVTLFNLRDYCKTEEDLDRTLQRVKAIGYQNIQVSGVGPIAPSTIKTLADQHQLKIVASHENTNQLREDFQSVVDKLKAFDCDFTALGHPGGALFDNQASSIPAMLEELQAWGKQFKGEGIRFGYHNHELEFQKFNGRTLLDTIYEETPPDIIYAELDLHWVTRGGGSPPAWIKKVAGRMPVVHIKDFVIDANRSPRFCEIGEGNLDWPPILEALQETEVDDYVVEQDQEINNRNIFDSIEISFNNLKAMGIQ